MNIKSHPKALMEINGIVVDVVRKNIKNLHLSICPPDGTVRVAVPNHLNDEAVRLAVISKIGWIKKNKIGFSEQSRQSARQIVTGESHYYFGRRYRLDVVFRPGMAEVRVRNKSVIELYVPEGTAFEKREKIMSEWLRAELKNVVPGLILKWESVTGLKVSDWRVKRMKTMWGSCNIGKKRIWLNLELAKKPIDCLEYIILHEMVHFLQRTHNTGFVAQMNHFMPHWRITRDNLNRAPLAYENWKY